MRLHVKCARFRRGEAGLHPEYLGGFPAGGVYWKVDAMEEEKMMRER